MLRRSILNVVIRRVLAMTLLYVIAMSVLIYTQIDETLLLLRQKTLTESAYDIASYLEDDDHGRVILDMPQEVRDFYMRAGRFYQFVIHDDQGNILFRSPVAYVNLFPAKMPDEGQAQGIDFTGPYNTHFIGAGINFAFGDRHYLVQVAQGEQAVQEYSNYLAGIFLKKIAMIGLPFLLLLMVIIVVSIRQSLHPLRRLSRQAGNISFSSPGVRLAADRLPDEMAPLVRAVNGALDRLESGIETQREFTANAAHELRTPLSILRSHVDLLKDRDVAERLRADVNAMTRLVTQLLDVARLDHPGGFPRERLDLVGVIKDVCTTCWPLMIGQGRNFEVVGIDKPAWVNGNYDSIYRALRNLIDNAMHYTPKGSAISLELKGMEIRVADRGPGIADADKEKIFEKFWRKHASKGDGSGLGLSIVKRTMELHGGTIHIEDNPGGGAVFVLSFPPLAAHNPA